MKSSVARFAILLAVALLAGCAASEPTAEQRLGQVSMRSSSDLTTALPPIEAINQISHVFSNLRFDVRDQDLDRFGLHSGPASDYFFAAIAGSGANDTRVLAIAQWKDKGVTHVKFTSDLEPNKHGYVTELLRQALESPTTQGQ